MQEEEEWNEMIKEQFGAKRKQQERSNDLRAEELKLMRKKFEQDKLDREAQREEEISDREARREQDRKNLELFSAIINKLK